MKLIQRFPDTRIRHQRLFNLRAMDDGRGVQKRQRTSEKLRQTAGDIGGVSLGFRWSDSSESLHDVYPLYNFRLKHVHHLLKGGSPGDTDDIIVRNRAVKVVSRSQAELSLQYGVSPTVISQIDLSHDHLFKVELLLKLALQVQIRSLRSLHRHLDNVDLPVMHQ